MQTKARNPSVLRQELGALLEELDGLQGLFTSRAPLWKGNVYLMRRRCGRPQCHCAEGSLHEAVVLSDRSGDKPRTMILKPEDVDRFQRMTRCYSRYRRARARVVKIARRLVHIIDALGDIRLQEGQKGREKRKRE